MVKIGWIGCGFMGQLAHLANYLEIPNCEVVAIADVRYGLAQEVAAKKGIPKAYPSAAELLKDPDVEAVVAILPFPANHMVAMEVLKAGKHLFIEKPMSISAQQAREMSEAARQSGVKFMVGYMKRYDSGVEIAKNLVDELRASGELGQLRFARAHCYGGNWLCNVGRPITSSEAPPAYPWDKHGPGWLTSDEKFKFNIFTNVWIHNVNLLRHLLGSKVSVKYADLSTPSWVTVLDFDGVITSVEGGGISSEWWDEDTKLYFEHGWIEIKTPPPMLRNVPAKVEVYKAGKIQQFECPVAPWSWAFKREAEHFVQYVETGTEPRSPGSDGYLDMVLAEEIFEKWLGKCRFS